MAATVQVGRKTGVAPGTFTDITSINTRAAQNDTHTTAGTSNPIPIPTSGTSYSFWVTTRLKATTTPAGTIDNIRWFSDAVSFGTGVTVKGADASTGADAGYIRATSSIQLSTGAHAGLDGSPVDVTGLTSGSPRALSGSIVNPSTGEFGDHWVYSFEVGTTAGAGPTPSNVMSFRYDET